MSEPTITIDDIVLPAGTITGHAADVRADGPDPDPHPDVTAWEGQLVTLTPTVDLVVLSTADGPVLMRPQSVSGHFVGGELVLQEIPQPETGTPLRVWASTGQDMVPPTWGYRLSMPELPKVKPAPFVLDPGATVDVAAVLSGSLPDVPPIDPDALAEAVLAVLARADEVGAAVDEAGAAATRAEDAADRAEAVPASSTVVAAGRPDVPATTPYTAAQLNAMPVGSVYRSTDGPQGAWGWRKTGATSWVVTDGDTGPRAIPAADGSGATLIACRIGRVVELVMNSHSGHGTGTLTLGNVPSGFRPAANLRLLYGEVSAGPTQSLLLVRDSGDVQAYDKTSGGLYFASSYSTQQPWPTTLPGTPA